MAIRKSALLYTIEEYLAIDRQTEERYEYLDGQVLAMSGESEAQSALLPADANEGRSIPARSIASTRFVEVR